MLMVAFDDSCREKKLLDISQCLCKHFISKDSAYNVSLLPQLTLWKQNSDEFSHSVHKEIEFA